MGKVFYEWIDTQVLNKGLRRNDPLVAGLALWRSKRQMRNIWIINWRNHLGHVARAARLFSSLKPIM